MNDNIYYPSHITPPTGKFSESKLIPIKRLGHLKGDWYEWYVKQNDVSGTSQGNHNFSLNSGEFEPD